MAITNNLVPELERVEGNLRRRALWREVSDTLFGVLEGQENPRVIIDSATYGLLTTIRDISDYNTQRNTLNARINGAWWYISQLDSLRTGAYTNAPKFNAPNIGNPQIDSDTLKDGSWDGGLEAENQVHINISNRIEMRFHNAYLSATSSYGRANLSRARSILTTMENDRHNREINRINARIEEVKNNMRRDQTELDKLNAIWWLMAEMNTRNAELIRMINALRNLNMNSRIPNIGVDYAPLPGNPPVTSITNLQNIFGNVAGITYDICENNDSWNPLPTAWWGRKITLAGWQTITLRGLTINGTNLEANNVTVDPVEWITFPLHLELAIRWRVVDAATWVAMDHYKPVRFTLNAPNINPAQRTNIYNTVRPAIDNRIASEYSNPRRETIENEVIWAILRDHRNAAEIDAIQNDEWSRALLLERMRAIPNLIPAFTVPNLIAEYQAEAIRNVPAQYLTSENAFRDYLSNDLEQKVRNFVSRRIREEMETHHREMISTLLNFQADVKNQNIDNGDDQIVSRLAVLNDEPVSHTNLWRRLTGAISRKDNWTKFFTGRTADAIDGSMEVDGKEYNYNIVSAVQWVNKVTTTIKINDEEPLILDARDLNQLVRLILNQEVTKEWNPLPWKIRCRMAVDAIKWFVSISPTTLSRELRRSVRTARWNNEPIDRITARIRGGNLEVIASRSDNATRRRTNFTVFDERRYKALHTQAHLTGGVTELAKQVNDIMNAMSTEFNTATKNRDSFQLMRYGTSFPLQGWPIKKWRTKLRHGETNWDFNFTTDAHGGSKDVQIRFQDWKFTLSGEFDGKPYEISGRNLWKLLRHKINRKRIFDGVELAIVQQVNETMIQKLRTNALIWPENFVVSDRRANKTGRVFFFDSYGDLSYLDIEDATRFTVPRRGYDHIDATNLPPARVRCNARERADFIQNPFLSWRLLRAMRARLSF